MGRGFSTRPFWTCQESVGILGTPKLAWDKVQAAKSRQMAKDPKWSNCNCANENSKCQWRHWPLFSSGGECRNPTLAKCGGEAQHLETLQVGSFPGLPNVQSSTTRPKTPCIKAFLVSLERSWNVDIENALALAICISVAQVMGKRRAGSQTGSLTPDH
jgi:hypothetical protein